MSVAPERRIRIASAGRFFRIDPELHKRLFPSLPIGSVVRGGVAGDGSCFFHSAAAAINLDGYLTRSKRHAQRIGQKFRKTFARHMRESEWEALRKASPHNFRKSFHDVKKSFHVTTEWAEETMIKYVSKKLGINIVFIDSTSNKFYCFIHGDRWQEPTIIIMWVDHSHFEPVFLVRETRDGLVALDGVMCHDCKRDAQVVSDLDAAFTEQCNRSMKA